MKIEILEQTFDPFTAVLSHQESLQASGKYGALATFIGSMRDFNEGDAVSKMELEHYPEMTEKHLRTICDRAQKKWDVIDILLIHRIGEIEPGEAIVLVAVWSAHRAVAFDACRFIMEDLKSEAPFWKQETLANGKRWVDKNTAG